MQRQPCGASVLSGPYLPREIKALRWHPLSACAADELIAEKAQIKRQMPWPWV